MVRSTEKLHHVQSGSDLVVFADKLKEGKSGVLDEPDRVYVYKDWFAKKGKGVKPEQMNAKSFADSMPGIFRLGQSYDMIEKMCPRVQMKGLPKVLPARSKPLITMQKLISSGRAKPRRLEKDFVMEPEFGGKRYSLKVSVRSSHAIGAGDEEAKQVFVKHGYHFISTVGAKGQREALLLAVPREEYERGLAAVRALVKRIEKDIDHRSMDLEKLELRYTRQFAI